MALAVLSSFSIAADLSACYLQNINLRGGDVGFFVTSNKDKTECYEACIRHPECTAFTFQVSRGNCWLKNSKHRDPNNQGDLFSGKIECFDEKIAADPVVRNTGEMVEYEFEHLTNGGKYDGGAKLGYWYTVVGSEGETPEHECEGDRTLAVTGSCSFEDATVIGKVMGVKIGNGGDDSWKFTKMAVKVDGVALPSYYGYKNVDDYKSVSLSFSDDVDSCYMDSINLYGSDIRSFTTLQKDKTECYEACRRLPKCTAFTFQISGRRCWLKTSNHRDPNSQRDLVSGKMECFREKGTPEKESEFINVAQSENVTVAQSGSRSGAGADRAIDGNFNTRWDVAGCSYSWDYNINWWQITLDKVYTIDHVIIYGLSDAWRNDEGVLNGARLIVGSQICEVISGMKENATEGHTFNCKDDATKKSGKIVRLENWYKKLVICEIEIMVKKDLTEQSDVPTADPTLLAGQEIDDFYNVAYKKKTFQSSTAHDGMANKAVDGWTIQKWAGRHGSCTHTGKRTNDYWSVDLGRVYQIDHIRVWGREDGSSTYMAGAMLWVDNNFCARMKDMKKSGPEHVKCDKVIMAGGNVTISQNKQYVSICEVQVMVKKTDIDLVPKSVSWPGEKVGNFTNVALNHPAVNDESSASQSTTGYNGFARLANDGNRDGNYRGGSVTHTLNTGPQYWKVDLGRVYKINSIVIYGRTDCCSERIHGARVRVGQNILVANNIQKPSNPADPINIDLSEDDVYGRNVTVELLNNVLSLAEVEVWVANQDLFVDEMPTADPSTVAGQEIENFYNVAYEKKTFQSSTAHDGLANKAVDGWTVQKWAGKHGSCTHTGKRTNDYWSVDLGRVYQIDHIRVWGREDGSSTYMAGAMLWVDSNFCARLKDMKKSGPEHVKCDKVIMAGGNITISQNKQYVSICEVQVMVKKTDIDLVPKSVSWPGEKVGNFTNVALNSPAVNDESSASQSTTAYNGFARLANDGNRDGNYRGGSVTHTLNTGLQYWQVDLGRVYKINRISIYGRTDCCSERIQGARVRVGRSLRVADNIQKPSNPADPINIDLSEGGVYGKSVTLELVNNVLSLAEVEVWVANEDLFGDEMPTVVPMWENVAVRRATNQSSTLGGHNAERAIDDFPAQLNPRSGSCTHTEKKEINWWEVDLVKEYHIDHIKVFGRNDDDNAAKRINGATILLDGRTVGGFEYKSKNDVYLFPLNGLKGRVVRIVKLDDYLTLCEVQVMVNNEYEPKEDSLEPIKMEQINLASTANASSSSAMYGAKPDYVIDENTESNFFRGSCFYAGSAQNGNWLKLDLEKKAQIGHIFIYPRLDYSASESIDGAVVKAGEHTCGVIGYESGKMFYDVDCGGSAATDEVSVSMFGKLSFCEIVVQESSE